MSGSKTSSFGVSCKNFRSSGSKLPTWLGISTRTAKSCSSRNVAIAEKVYKLRPIWWSNRPFFNQVYISF